MGDTCIPSLIIGTTEPVLMLYITNSTLLPDAICCCVDTCIAPEAI